MQLVNPPQRAPPCIHPYPSTETPSPPFFNDTFYGSGWSQNVMLFFSLFSGRGTTAHPTFSNSTAYRADKAFPTEGCHLSGRLAPFSTRTIIFIPRDDFFVKKPVSPMPFTWGPSPVEKISEGAGHPPPVDMYDLFLLTPP